LIDEEDPENDLDDIFSKDVPRYYAIGFEHPDLPVITNDDPHKLQTFSWGLIPFWVKDPKQAVIFSNKTLNARGEEMFEKPSFRNSAKNKRCLVLIDGFFEYHWHNDKAYPYYIQLKNSEPMVMAGLWEFWHFPSENIHRYTVSIVTTVANDLMTYIHNKPSGSQGPRMPVILSRENERKWLIDVQSRADQDQIQALIHPYEESEMIAYTVPKLKGKDGIGNNRDAIKEFRYVELD
jgi:putative SOS response-associated peptidase YedK